MQFEPIQRGVSRPAQTQSAFASTILGPQAAAEQTLLIREFTHRIANDWSSAVAAVSLAARNTRSEEAKFVLANVAGQLLHHAQLLRVLEAPVPGTMKDAAEYIGQICFCLGRAKLESLNIRLVLAADPLPLMAEDCWRLGMIVFELITNSARHAFWRGLDGTIRVDLVASQQHGERR